MNKKIALIMSCVLLASCAMHPLGIDDATWQKMTPTQQADAYQKQAEISAKQQAAEQAQAAAQQRKIQDIKNNPKYGQYVQCVFSDGKYNDNFNSFNPVENFNIDALEGETTNKSITYYQNGNKFFANNVELSVSFDGQQISICDTNNEFNKPCSNINATSSEYRRGVSRNIDNGILKGKIRCNMVFHGHRHSDNSNGGNNIVINI